MMMIQSPTAVTVVSLPTGSSLFESAQNNRNDEIGSPPTNEAFLSQKHGLGKNLNLYWLATSGLAIWFLLVHTPPLLRRRMNPLFALHLLGAGGIYLICIHNALVTPSTFQGRGKLWHINLGRIGMILGIVGVLTGFILSWTSIDRVGLGFAVPISIGGVFQLMAQYKGYQHIRTFQRLRDEEEEALRKVKLDIVAATSASTSSDCATTCPTLRELQEQKRHHLNSHIEYMVGTFVLACGIPAVMRLLVQVDAVWPYVVAIVALNILSHVYSQHLVKRPESQQSLPDDLPANSTTSLL